MTEKPFLIVKEYYSKLDLNSVLFLLSLILPAMMVLIVYSLKNISLSESSFYSLNIGSKTDTNVSELYIEPKPSISERKINEESGSTYRNLSSTANIIFKPKKFTQDSTLTANVTGSGTAFILPEINFDPYNYKWNHVFDFENGYPQKITGNVFSFDRRVFFDGKTGRIEIPNSKDLYDNGPFMVYAKWEPRSNEFDYQQIVGRFNWEIFQNKESVIFQVGRLDDNTGKFVILSHPVSQDFFGQTHELLAVYNPSSVNNEIGYIEMYIDNEFAGREIIGGQKIWNNYGNHNISFGKSKHGISSFYNGFIDKVMFTTSTVKYASTTISHKLINSINTYTLVGSTGTIIESVKIHVNNRKD